MAPDGREDTLIQMINDNRIEGLVTRVERVTRKIVEQCPTLRVIQQHGTGMDNIDIAAATAHGVRVQNVPDGNISVAEHVVMSILALSRNLVQADKAVRVGNWKYRETNIPHVDIPYPIVVSDMNAEACDKLHIKFPDRVTAAKSLQECVDRSEWIIIAVWPNAGEEVLRSLTFRPNHKIINIMFDKTVEQVASWINCKVDTLLHMIPGTFLSFYPGPIVQCPPTPEAAEIFGHIGKIINVDSRYQAAVFGSITGCFAPMFAIMNYLIDWAVSEGVPSDAATKYVTNMFAAVCQEVCGKDRAGVHTMATVSTPGGINMLALELITKAGGFQAWVDAMKPVMIRTAGSIPKE